MFLPHPHVYIKLCELIDMVSNHCISVCKYRYGFESASRAYIQDKEMEYHQLYLHD